MWVGANRRARRCGFSVFSCRPKAYFKCRRSLVATKVMLAKSIIRATIFSFFLFIHQSQAQPLPASLGWYVSNLLVTDFRVEGSGVGGSWPPNQSFHVYMFDSVTRLTRELFTCPPTFVPLELFLSNTDRNKELRLSIFYSGGCYAVSFLSFSVKCFLFLVYFILCMSCFTCNVLQTRWRSDQHCRRGRGLDGVCMFARLPGFSGFLAQSKNVHVRRTGASKLSVGADVSANGCLPLCDPAASGYKRHRRELRWDPDASVQ